MAENYYITLEVHDEGEWPRIAPENLMQHVDVRLPSGLTLAGAGVSESVNSFDELVSALEGLMWRFKADDDDPLDASNTAPDIVAARAVLAKVKQTDHKIEATDVPRCK